MSRDAIRTSRFQPLRVAAGAIAVSCLVAPAAAQGLAGTAQGAAAPGRFALGVDVGALSIDVPRLSYGNFYASPGLIGTPSSGRVVDAHGRSTRAVPAIGLAWGLPGGVLGWQAELYGRFVYAQAATSAGGTFATDSPSPTNTMAAIPFVAVTSVSGGAITAASNLLGSASAGSSSIDSRRDLTTYDGTAGLRLHRRSGALGLSPGLFAGYVRSTTDDSIVASLSDVNSGNATVRNATSVRGNTFRFGLSFGADYALAPRWTAFGTIEGGLDVVDASLSGSSTISFASGSAPHFAPASAADSSTRVSGRVGANAGIAYAVTPGFMVSLAGMVSFVGAVPVTRYADAPSLAPGIGSNSVYGRTVGARLVGVDFESQLNFGGLLGATLKF